MKKHRVARVNRAMFISAAALACCAGLLSAGSLTPPAGPIGGSFKTLGEVEPRIALSSASTPGDADSVYRITAPGSYYLVGSVAAPSGKTGIEIACDGVTVDLNGFVLTGATGSLDGLRVTGNNRRNIEIRDGTIEGFQGAGINLRSETSSWAGACRVERVRVSGCGGSGAVLGTSSVATELTASGNAGGGVYAHESCMLVECTLTGNASFGALLNSGCSIRGSSVAANLSDGIMVGHGALISGCTVTANGGAGVRAGSGSEVKACVVSENVGDGIAAGGLCLIAENECVSNGLSGSGANIHVEGRRTRVEANHCTQGARGILVTSPQNIIIRNTCAENGVNWSIVPDNAYGSIVCAGPSAGVSGDSAAGCLGTADPNANFTH